MDMQSLQAKHGITRVSDITGVDVIGVPVWSAIRPAARSYSVSAGKGLNPMHARLTAVMEAVETSCAEKWEQLCTHTGSISSMSERSNIVPLELISKVRRRPNPDTLRYWVEGHDINGKRLLAPYETIGVDLRANAGWDTWSFKMTSAGTAAHTDPDQALSSALLEAIENDARALALSSAAGFSRLKFVTFDQATPAGELVRDITEKEIFPVMLDATSDIGFPVALCLLYEAPDANGTLPVKTHAGSACRKYWHEACLDALLEALQARVTTILGARDDIQPSDFARCRKAPMQKWSRGTPPPDGPDTSPDEIVAALFRAGFGSPIIFDLAPGLGPSCVSVLVPGLMVQGGRPNQRMRSRLIGDALLRP